ncbi:HlyD family secretion protein [Vibrio kyushuensis]|uniref:HlyD family secretion protein n=1 Tax=Vibrio kyushuensis TaxID=2910249 RepID=UPI003D14C647
MADKPEVDQVNTKKNNKVKTTTNTVLSLALLSIGLCVVGDRIIPTTDNVRVEGSTVSLIPQVSGSVSSIQVEPNTLVKKGDVLAQINPIDYQIAVDQAETELRLAGQQVEAQMADIVSAQAKLTTAIVSQDNAKRQGQRVLAMASKGLVSQADADKTQAELDKAEANVLNANANLDRIKTQLGAAGEDNAQIQAALLALQKAQLDLERTTLRAPSDGAVTNFDLSEGAYASAGSPLMTFIAEDNLWVEAFFRENSMGNLKPGDKVEVALDYAPGETYEGTVKSVDLGVEWGANRQAGSLANVKKQNGWMRDSQRMPVTIQLDSQDAGQVMRIGGQADVVVYTGDNTLFNALGYAWIRLVSWFSYVR